LAESEDIVVIGGGAVGTAIAYFLAQKGLDVTLLEKGCIADGSSGKCDGNVVLHDTLPGYDCQLKKLSLDMFPTLAQELDYDIGWSRKGSVLVIENDVEMEVAQNHCRLMQEYGYPFKILERAELRADEPHLADDIAGGMEVACDGSLNPMALAYGLMQGAKKLGAKIQIHTCVTEIKRDANGRIECVATDRGKIRTRQIVNAAGVWAADIGAMVQLDIPVKPRQGQLIVGERTFAIGKRKISEFGYIMAKFERSDYQRSVTPAMEKHGVALVFEPTEAGTCLIGSSRRFTGQDISNNLEVIRAIAQRAMRFFPVLKHIRVIRTYAGLRPYTPDHFPIISETEIPGFYVAAGHEGNGIGLSLITGKLVSQMICRESTDISMEPLKLSRFGQKG
jgi:glycine/D-amino acid oxidase-like deaminating enzyme